MNQIKIPFTVLNLIGKGSASGAESPVIYIHFKNQTIEFYYLYHSDTLDNSGFISLLKFPAN